MSATGAAIETVGLSKRYGRRWVLSELTMTVPKGAITALVGPNGAGKSTLLRILAGITEPSAGEARVLGGSPRDDKTVARIGYLDQERPLYRDFRVAEMLRFGKALNPTWSDQRAKDTVGELGIPLDRRIRQLSGGQRAQVALTLCLAKQPELLLLDEPVASLDPVAREDLMAVLLRSVVDDGTTVLLSSHAIGDLAGVCDHLVILRQGGLVLSDSLDHVLATHRLAIGPSQRDERPFPPAAVVGASTDGRQRSVLLRGEHLVLPPSWDLLEPTLEEIVLAYLRQSPAPGPAPVPSLAATGASTGSATGASTGATTPGASTGSSPKETR